LRDPVEAEISGATTGQGDSGDTAIGFKELELRAGETKSPWGERDSLFQQRTDTDPKRVTGQPHHPIGEQLIRMVATYVVG
jgi:hypothetical protein